MHDPALLNSKERNTHLRAASLTLRWLAQGQDSSMVYRTSDIAEGINRSRHKVWKDLKLLASLGIITYGSSGRYGVYIHLDRLLANRWLGGAPN